MFCEKCGAKNDSSSKYCEMCGTKLDNEVQKTTKKSTSLKEKYDALDKKEKVIGAIVLTILLIVIVFYIVGLKMTSLETIGSKAFEELADKSTVNNKYLSVPLDSEDYFLSLKDNMKETIEDEEINFDYKNYTITTGTKKITIKYRDTENDEKYKVIFEVEKNGKSLMIFDKYVITKITVESEEEYDKVVLYDPENTNKLTLTTIKGSKIIIDEKEISDKYINSKKSDKENDVYVINGVATGKYNVQFTVGKLVFEKSIYIYSDEDSKYDLTKYISYSYLSDNNKEFNKIFKSYISTYYEYAMDSTKTVEDFGKKYELTDNIKDLFATSKEAVSKLAYFKVNDVTVRTLYYYSSDKELVVTYKMDYTYKLTESEEEQPDYKLIKVKYDLSNIELPIDLDYMPY